MAESALLMPEVQEIRANWANARPFPHAVRDGVLRDETARSLFNCWPGEGAAWGQLEKGAFSRLKRKFDNIKRAPEPIRDTLKWGNSPNWLRSLEIITGIEGLIADPEFHGAGLHETMPGGFLKRHIDFNRTTVGDLICHRRLNVFLYLNPDWQEEWNGHLCLAASKTDANPLRISPLFNRMVICEASERSWHGHPEPLACPKGVSRKSLAWYYYTAEPGPDAKLRHSTIYVKDRK